MRNPMNFHQVSKIDLSPDVVDCIVFWTKNPEPMMDRLDELSAYKYYFQFTLTGYGPDMEKNVPHKRDKMIPIFQALSDKIGSRNVIWRYDPIIFTKKYTPEYHLKAFDQIAQALNGYTHKCVISFVDIYKKNTKNMNSLEAYELPDQELMDFAQSINNIAVHNEMTVGSCAERIDLQQCGIEHNCCIDKNLIEEIVGCKINAGKDKNQRAYSIFYFSFRFFNTGRLQAYMGLLPVPGASVFCPETGDDLLKVFKFGHGRFLLMSKPTLQHKIFLSHKLLAFKKVCP